MQAKSSESLETFVSLVNAAKSVNTGKVGLIETERYRFLIGPFVWRSRLPCQLRFLGVPRFRSAQIKDWHIVPFLSSIESRCLSERSFKRFIQYFPAWNLTLHQHGKHESIDWDFAKISKTFYLITLDFKVIYHVLSRSFDSILWTSQFFGFHLSLHLLFLSLTCDI